MRAGTNVESDGTSGGRERNIARAKENAILQIVRAEARLSNFSKLFHNALNPGDPYVSGWHLDFMAEHLEAALMGQILRLVINVPPGSSKSTLVSCMFPTWAWRHWPQSEWGFSSFTRTLGQKFSTNRRRIIRDPRYQDAWGHIIKLRDDQDEKLEMENTQRGKFFVTSTGGSVGGQHFDFIVIDDPQNPEKDVSKIDTEDACEHVKYMANTRLKNKDKGRVILVMQRLSKTDASSVLLMDSKTVHVTIPMTAPESKLYSFPVTKRTKWVDEGDIFWPEVFTQEFVRQQKKELGPYKTAAQLQQDPQSMDGNLVKRSWWMRWQERPKIAFKIWALDTATKAKEENDFTAAALIEETDDGWNIVRIVKRKMEAALLETFIEDLYAMEKTDAVVIEDKDSGQRVIQYFQKKKKIPVIAFKPSQYGDKVQRLSRVSPSIQAGKVALPDNSVVNENWVEDFLEELDSFPRGLHDDQVDAVSTGLIYLKFDKKQVGDVIDQPPEKRPEPIMPGLKTQNPW